jgi:hypothetical protein
MRMRRIGLEGARKGLLLLEHDGSLLTLVDDAEAQRLETSAAVAKVGPSMDRIVTSNLVRRHVAIAVVGLRGVPLRTPSILRAS